MKSNKQTALFTSLLATGLLLVSAAAFPQTAAPATTAESIAPSAQPTAVVDPEAQPDAKTEAGAADRSCDMATGSRIVRTPRKGNRCVSSNGRSYSREDIDRTGSIDLADALRRLDPTIH